MRRDGSIDYAEFPAADLAEVKAFYRAAFGWGFQDWGDSYAALDGAGLDGGFNADPAEAPAKPLIVIYATDIEAAAERVAKAGGVITRPIFAFPGGRRFHFRDPSGNELAVWSEPAE